MQGWLCPGKSPALPVSPKKPPQSLLCRFLARTRVLRQVPDQLEMALGRVAAWSMLWSAGERGLGEPGGAAGGMGRLGGRCPGSLSCLWVRIVRGDLITHAEPSPIPRSGDVTQESRAQAPLPSPCPPSSAPHSCSAGGDGSAAFPELPVPRLIISSGLPCLQLFASLLVVTLAVTSSPWLRNRIFSSQEGCICFAEVSRESCLSRQPARPLCTQSVSWVFSAPSPTAQHPLLASHGLLLCWFYC